MSTHPEVIPLRGCFCPSGLTGMVGMTTLVLASSPAVVSGETTAQAGPIRDDRARDLGPVEPLGGRIPGKGSLEP